MTYQNDTYAIVADIGGTNTRVALADGLSLVDCSIQRFENAAFPGLDAVLAEYLSQVGNPRPQAICVAVAGPVADGQATLTNLDWTIDNALLCDVTGASQAAILNDLQAQGYAIDHIAADLIDPVMVGDPASTAGARLVVGVGTGFNAVPVLQNNGTAIVPASEAGHISLPTVTPQERALADYLAQEHGFAAVEDALSGRGLVQIDSFLGAQAGDLAKRDGKKIIAACDAGQDERAQAAVALFAQLLGRVCGDLALVQLPFGGIYLVGGMARAIAPYLQNAGFADAFTDKGRFKAFNSQFSVSLVTDDYAALTGCAAYLNEKR